MSTTALKLVFIILSWGLPRLASLPLHSTYLLLFDFLWLHTAVLIVTGTEFIPVQTKQVLSRIELHLCFVLCLFVRLDFAHWQKEIIKSIHYGQNSSSSLWWTLSQICCFQDGPVLEAVANQNKGKTTCAAFLDWGNMQILF